MGSGISALVRGSSTRLIASSGLEWAGISLELHDASPVERNESVSSDHLISVIVDHPSTGETSLSSGRFVPYIYHPGAINLLPAGPIPACRPFTKTKMIICALDPGLVRDVGEDSKSPAVSDLRRTVNLHDRSLEGIVKLLAAEADSGGIIWKTLRGTPGSCDGAQISMAGTRVARGQISPADSIAKPCTTASFRQNESRDSERSQSQFFGRRKRLQ